MEKMPVDQCCDGIANLGAKGDVVHQRARQLPWIASVGAGLIGSLAIAASSSAAGVVFDHRENLNILNSPDVSILGSFVTSAALFTDNPNLLRGAAHDTSASTVGWFTGFFAQADKAILTMDLGAVRNIKTIRMGGARVADSATIQTSVDGITWSGGLGNSVTTPSGDPQQRTFTLNAAADSRYLRFTADSYSFVVSGLNSLALANLRVYGDVGTVNADRGLDLVSYSGWTAGGATITRSSGGFTPGNGLSDMANDVPVSPGEGMTTRQLVFSMQTGSHVTATFNQAIDDMERVGVTIANGSYLPGFDANMHFQLLGSSDNFATSTVLLDQTGGLVIGQNFFTLPSLFDGLTAVRFQIVSAATNDNRVSDLMVFQNVVVPEPASLSVLAIAGSVLARRRRA